ncbi:hypothetical protein PQZ07_00725 [bacterium]|nr:hypothetical protein [bacterium]
MTDSDGRLVEVPSKLNADNSVNETLSKKLAETAYYELGTIQTQVNHISSINATQVKDTTYLNGSATRTDYAVGTTQGQAIVTKLNNDFSGEVSSFDNNTNNLVGEYTAQRPPYNINNNISFYNFDVPTDTIKNSFGATYNEYKKWYGLKFDTVTNDVLAKFVIPETEMKRVDVDTYNEINALLPIHCYQFYARIHDKSSNINENVDVYFQADPSVMKSWCTTNSYTFPYDTTDSTIEPLLFIWGCVYNTTSETITHVKAYARTTV